MAIEVFAALRYSPAEMRRRVNGLWALEWTPPANNVPHTIRAAPDGTLFMTSIDFSTGNGLWRQSPGETTWTKVATGAGGYSSITGLHVISKDEVWVSASQYVARWTTGGGWTNVYHMATEAGTFRFYEAKLFAFAADHVIVIGHDNSGNNQYVAYFNGSTWNLEATIAQGGYPLSLYGNGNDLWYGNGGTSQAKLWHHPAKGVGAGWSNITGAGWPATGGVNGIYGTATDLWVSISNTTGGVDASRTLNNGSSWTNYTRNAAGDGCTSVHGAFGKVFIGHVSRSEVTVWDGASLSTEALGGGNFGDWLYGTGSYASHQRVFAQLITDFTLTSADKTNLPQNGGELVTVLGVFATGASYTVHFGPLGTTADPVVYAGLIGGANAQTALNSDTTIQFVSPPAAKGTGYKITVDDGVVPQTLSGFSVVEQSYYNRTFETRRLWPPWYSTGARHLKREPRQDS